MRDIWELSFDICESRLDTWRAIESCQARTQAQPAMHARTRTKEHICHVIHETPWGCKYAVGCADKHAKSISVKAFKAYKDGAPKP